MIILIISAWNNGDLMYEPLFIKIIRAARGLFITTLQRYKLPSISSAIWKINSRLHLSVQSTGASKTATWLSTVGKTRETIYHLGVYNLNCGGLEVLVKGWCGRRLPGSVGVETLSARHPLLSRKRLPQVKCSWRMLSQIPQASPGICAVSFFPSLSEDQSRNKRIRVFCWNEFYPKGTHPLHSLNNALILRSDIYFARW